MLEKAKEWDKIFQYVGDNGSWGSFKERLTVRELKEIHSIIRYFLVGKNDLSQELLDEIEKCYKD